MAKIENRDTSREAKSPRGQLPVPSSAPPASPLARCLQWFLSATVRHATAMRKHVQRLLQHQRDILSPQAIEALQAALTETRQVVAQRVGRAALEKQMEKLEKAANQWLKPYPNPGWRENVEVLLVALTVAMAIRTFFLQPFKIPTGSMQPTLYGVTSTNLINVPEFKIPTGCPRVREWFEGVSYIHKVAVNDGALEAVDPPFRIAIFNIWQTLVVGGSSYTIWFPPDYGAPPTGTLEARADLHIGQLFRKGQDIVRLKVNAGDHLFVDRVTYNFRSPERGEIIVFETKGIPEEYRDHYRIPADQFYIKRLVGLGGERVQIGPDRHLLINGKPLEASLPHFEKVYGFNPNETARDSTYGGHVGGPMAPFFQDHPDGVLIPKDSYMVMGDNTVNSLDSRFWGPFPASFVIGKSFFVYWPITDRFGWGYHR